MGVFKEEANVIETIFWKQTRIYTDSADCGYPYNTHYPSPEVTRLFETLNKLKTYKNITRNRREFKGGVSVDIVFFWEVDEGFKVGTKYTITAYYIGNKFNRINKDSNAYVTIDVKPYKEKA